MEKVKVSLRPIASKINLPTVIKTAILPGEINERLFIATQVGEIYYIGNNGKLETFLDIRDNVIELGNDSGYDERGLLGLAFHPKFNTNGIFYIHYSLKGSNGEGALHSSFIPNPCNQATNNLKWENRVIKYDHIDTIEEWVIQANGRKSKRRTILNIRRPFINHNGVNSLSISPETNNLVFVNGDGGSGYDPYNLAQDNLEIAGKIIEIDINKNVYIAKQPIVTRFDELPNPIQDLFYIVGKGIRNSVGLVYQNINKEYMKYIGNVGQELVETIFTFGKYKLFPVRELINSNNPNTLINFGWRGWEGDFPTTVINPCPNIKDTEQLVIAYYDEAVKLSANHLRPLTNYYQYDPREDKFEGNALTGVQLYNGTLLPQLQGKLIFTDFINSRSSNSQKGILAYTDSIQNNSLNEYYEIDVNYNFNREPAFFVSLGSNINQTKLYLGVNGSNKVTDFNLGTVYEVIPSNNN